jgi:pimeloyl-ACP methyl ester carboxylesterase
MHLLLIHGALGAAPQMAPLAEALASRHRTHLVELEGHGGTPLGAAVYSMTRFVANLGEFIESREIGPASIFGYSMGGYVALQLAAARPDLVASVATLGTKLAWTPEVAARETGRLDPAKIRAKVPQFALQLEERHRAIPGGWEGVLARTAALMTGLGARPVVDDALLSRIRQPVRLMVGERDAVVSIDETRAAARHLAAGECIVLPDTPHPIEQVQVALLSSHMDTFLR